MARNARRMRDIGAERGLDWDAIDDEERERLVDDIIHEPRQPGAMRGQIHIAEDFDELPPRHRRGIRRRGGSPGTSHTSS